MSDSDSTQDTEATENVGDGTSAGAASWDPAAWENALIADLREHDGRPSFGPLAGDPILLLYTTGAKSGERRRAILTYSRDGDDYVVVGSAGGAPTDPAWIGNVKAHPDVTIEIGKRSIDGTASVAGDADQPRLWDQHVATNPRFAEYPEKAGRTIPVVRITPKA
jgi:deazaflavin-dependent oxidoreductase (nitroreductase family)